MKPWSILFGFVLMLGLPLSLSAEEYTLDDLYRLALARAEKIKLAEENVTLAALGKEKAMSVLMPRLTAYGNYTRFSEDKYNDQNLLIQPENATQWGLRADQQFSLSLREFTALSYAKQNIAKSRQDLSAAQEDYLFQVAQAYYDCLRAQKGLDIANANLERITKYRDMAAQRLKIGEVTKTVLLRAEGELSGATAEKVRAENIVMLTKTVLARIIGIENAFTLKEAPAAEAGTPVLKELQETAFAERADLKSLAHLQTMADQQVRYARGSFWPNLALSGVYQKADQEPESMTLNKESTYGALGLSFPFYEGGLRKAEVAEAKARQRQAHYQYEDLKKTIGMEVEAAYLDLITQQGTLTYLGDQQKFARDNYAAVARQFAVGLASSIDLLDANALLVSAEKQLTQAAYTYQVAILKIKKVTGTLLREIVPAKQG